MLLFRKALLDELFCLMIFLSGFALIYIELRIAAKCSEDIEDLI